jgi:hypothetical protein
MTKYQQALQRLVYGCRLDLLGDTDIVLALVDFAQHQLELGHDALEAAVRCHCREHVCFQDRALLHVLLDANITLQTKSTGSKIARSTYQHHRVPPIGLCRYGTV